MTTFDSGMVTFETIGQFGSPPSMQTEKSNEKARCFLSGPEKLDASLAHIRTYWAGLKRGENEIPFWDDLNLIELSELSKNAMLIEVIENPLRFRFDIVGRTVANRYGTEIDGRFLDEMDEREPIDQLNSQCRVTVDSRASTYFRYDARSDHPVLLSDSAPPLGQWAHPNVAWRHCLTRTAS